MLSKTIIGLYSWNHRARRRPLCLSHPHLVDVPVPDASAPRDKVLFVPVPLHGRLPLPRLPEGDRRTVYIAKGTRLNNSLTNTIQRSQKWSVRGCEKLVPALAYLFCTVLLGSCLARFTDLFWELCTKIKWGGRTGSNGRRSKEDAIMYNDLIGKSPKGK